MSTTTMQVRDAMTNIMIYSPSSLQASLLLDETTTRSQPAITLSDLCDDVLLLICGHLEIIREHSETPLKSLTLTSRRLSHLLSPLLFKSLHINAPLKILHHRPLSHYHASTLKVDMFGSLWWWCSGIYVSSTDAIDLFRFIHRFERLRTLEVSMMGRSVDIFEAAFQFTGAAELFTLPTIDSLVVTSSAMFLARHCPNLQSLVVRDGDECTIEAYADLDTRLVPTRPKFADGSLPSASLTRLDSTAVWSAHELNFLVSTFPHLRSLNMHSDTYCYRTPISEITHLLGSGLAQLHTLRLSKIHKLDMGFRSVWKRRIQECKTDASRLWLWRKDEAARVRAENEVARLAFGRCGALMECWVGETRVARRIVVGEGDSVVAKWMWERRREEVETCGMSTLWAKYRVEKEAAVVGCEVGM